MLPKPEVQTEVSDGEAMSTPQMLRDDGLDERAELQWRIGIPLSTIVLAFLAEAIDEIEDEASLHKLVAQLEKRMRAAAKSLEFEEAARLRDRIRELRRRQIYQG